ncbi:MAG: hypothetical protein OXC70_01240 [Gammaproteobacteria bacterium]|nr:hypothetical protein [Gammaproteobacteria bacterium]
MTLLDELRNLEPGNPGQWSRRVSVTLACMLLALVSAIGLQVRVRAQLLPQLASAGEALSGLETKLEDARRAERQKRSLREDLEQLAQRLQRSGARIPRGAESLDLAVALAAASAGSPVGEVRPWQPGGEISRRFPHLGAEMRLAGSYGEIISTIGMVLAAGDLRELAEFGIEAGDDAEDGRLRAEARLLGYFADDRHAGSLLEFGGKAPATANVPPPRADLPSPFARLSREMADTPAPVPADEGNSSWRGGVIQVGNRRWRIVDDPEGLPRLQPIVP